MSWLQRMRAHWRDNHPAILTDDHRVTYAQLTGRIERAAGWLLAQGIAPGDVVALQMPRSLAFLELHLAALGLGVLTLPLNATYPPAELHYYLQDSGAKLAIVLPDNLAALTETTPTHLVAADSALRRALDGATPADLPAELPGHTLAMVLYTSGTTGRPKGALLTHDNLRACVEGLHEAWRWSADDVLVHALPLFHVHGLFVGQHGALRAGATTRWLERFDAATALDTLQAGATLFMGVPTFYARFLALPTEQIWNLDGVRLFTSGSAPLPARDHQAFEARFGHQIIERYGMTEVGIVLTNPYEGERRPGSVGLAVPGARVVVFDTETDAPAPVGQVGEVRIAGPSVFQGYLGRPEATARALQDGWMRSGDLGRVDADGYIHLVGRSGDMILSGSLNVYPSEVESVLLEHPDVDQVAVVGVSDPDLGERVVATVVLSAGAQLADVQDLRPWARQHLAPYKVPKVFERADALPRNAMGKVQKARLRESWSATRVRPGRLDDADRLAAWNVAMALETEGIDLDPDTVARGVRTVFERPVGARYFIAERAGLPVGACMVTDEWSDWRARPVWWFQSVYVPPAWRRRGVFRTIHDQVALAARAAGAGGLRLYVDKRNTGAEATYRALGMDDGHYAMFEEMFDEPPPAEHGSR